MSARRARNRLLVALVAVGAWWGVAQVLAQEPLPLDFDVADGAGVI